MKVLGLAAKNVFSGFEKSFFRSLNADGWSVTEIDIEDPWFKMLCTVLGFRPSKSRWGLQRDRLYHTSSWAFKRKSRIARRLVAENAKQADIIYQVGNYWNPLGKDHDLPLVLQLSYTSLLSAKRNAEWKPTGKCLDFWVEEETNIYSKAAKVLTTTENARRSVIEDYGIPPDHVVTVGAGVTRPYDRLEPDRLPQYASRKVLFVGKGHHGKGLDTLLSALALVRRRIPDASLTVVGPSQPVAGEGVTYLGRIADREKVKNLFYDHAVFAMPSRFEPFGQVFIEAMSCKLPCIGTTMDAMPELIDHGTNGYLIEPGDVEALADHLTALLGDPSLCQSLGRASFEKLCTRYTWPIVGGKIMKELLAVAKRRR